MSKNRKTNHSSQTDGGLFAVPEMELSKVEIVKKKYDAKGYCIEEQWEYYYPSEKQPQEIGFNLNERK